MKRMRRNEHTQILDFCTPDGIRSGIHYECGFAVAMTSRIIAIIKESYNPNLENKTIDMYGNPIEGKYPDWRKVLYAIQDAEANEPYKVFTFNHDDFTQFHNKMTKELRNKAYLESNYYVICSDVYFLVDEFKKVADMMNIKGMNEFNVFPYDSINGTRPSFCCNDNGILAIMPTRLQEQMNYNNLIHYPLLQIVSLIRNK